VKQLEGLFDIPPSERSEVAWDFDVPIEEREWQVGLIVGPSGCGKTTIAREMFGEALAAKYDWPAGKSIVDAFPKTIGIKDIVGILSSVGFSSPPSWMRPFGVLSNGEQFRASVARAIAENPELVVIDEFTSVVDRTVAKVGSAAVAKAIRARPTAKFVAVSCHYDIIDWLTPDWVFGPSSGEFHWRSERRRPSITLEIARVHHSAWKLFKKHHYLSGDLNKAAYCFVGSVEGYPAAFVSAIANPGKYGGYFREHRTVCLPDFQGVGIGNAMSNYVAGMLAARKKYCSTTGNPAMIRHRAKSPLWTMTRKPSRCTGDHSGEFADHNKTTASHRITAGFKYCGPKNAADARAFGLL
jgi:hypothetical protein